jgi:sulfatase modifying factor 1
VTRFPGFWIGISLLTAGLLYAADIWRQTPRAASSLVPSGFVPIFNGRDLTGWHISRSDHHGSTPGVFVRDRVLHLGQSPYGQGGLLLTDQRYHDFELYLEVRAVWGCNSGIFLRSTEGGSAYQIELDQGRGTGDLLGENLSLSQTAKAAKMGSIWKNGGWNSFLIHMTGEAPHITEWVNGVEMWDVQEPRNDKIADETDGMIGLQAHWASTYEPAKDSFSLAGSWKPGAVYQFRNIAIKEGATTGRAHAGGLPDQRSGSFRKLSNHTRKQVGRTYTNSIGMEFVLIKAGKMQEAVFQPICPNTNDPSLVRKAGVNPKIFWTLRDVALCGQLVRRDASPGFPVRLSKSFYIGRFEVTQAEWLKVMGSNRSVFRQAKVSDNADQHPVDSVTWEDAEAFVEKLNKLERTSVYRLPTEFEWEYAGRAGGAGQVGWDEIRSQAVQGLRTGKNGSKPTTQMVGSKAPNAWGLYDMLGNVWEWVQDYYNEKTFPDPVPVDHGTQHVLKGGGFVSDVKNTIYSTHAGGPADGWDVGFRIVHDVE